MPTDIARLLELLVGPATILAVIFLVRRKTVSVRAMALVGFLVAFGLTFFGALADNVSVGTSLVGGITFGIGGGAVFGALMVVVREMGGNIQW